MWPSKKKLAKILKEDIHHPCLLVEEKEKNLSFFLHHVVH
jgi:hypothetical protein